MRKEFCFTVRSAWTAWGFAFCWRGHGPLPWFFECILTSLSLSLQWQDAGSALVPLWQVRVSVAVFEVVFLVVLLEGCLHSFKNRLDMRLCWVVLARDDPAWSKG